MTRQTTSEPVSTSLGDTIQSLSRSADSLETELSELRDTVDELQASTERCCVTRRSASTSLTRAAEAVSTTSGGTGAAATPPADD